MNATEIQSRIDALSAAMTAKGLKAAEASAMIRSHREPTVYLGWTDVSRSFDSAYESFPSKSLAVAFDLAVAFVAALPTPGQARLNEFMGALGKVIDLGRQNSIEVEFLNPLVATMKQLSENALTDQRAA